MLLLPPKPTRILSDTCDETGRSTGVLFFVNPRVAFLPHMNEGAGMKVCDSTYGNRYTLSSFKDSCLQVCHAAAD